MRFILAVVLVCFGLQAFAKKPLDLTIKNQTPYRTKQELLSPMKEDISLGNKDAKAKIVVFDSYSCVHCARFYAEIFPDLKKYIKEGKVHFVNKEFAIDSYAVFATKAVQCSANKLEALLAIYKMQKEWLSSKNYEDSLLKITGANKACIEKYDEKTAQKTAFEYSKVLNLRATPTVFINGKQLEKLSKKNFFQEIDEILKQKTEGANKRPPKTAL